MKIEHRTLRAARRAPVLCGLVVLTAGIILGAGNCAAQTNTDSGPTYESFKIITTRNIFNPNRSRYIPYTRTHTSPSAYESIALVGTMSYPKGKFAFFDGSSSQYKKVVEPGANIGGYTVKDVTATNVTLAANGKDFEMKVGAQLRNEAGAGWRLSNRTEPPASVDSGSTDAAPATATALPAGLSPEATDRLKQLMEQRQKEQQELK
ncbi:MAG TPA: hypothetical protein VG938_19855 [Verrucomicrobiae bacterium]|nr:hypothetical protein [Verrucomicrobiae bacterium]